MLVNELTRHIPQSPQDLRIICLCKDLHEKALGTSLKWHGIYNTSIPSVVCTQILSLRCGGREAFSNRPSVEMAWNMFLLNCSMRLLNMKSIISSHALNM